MTKKVVGRLWEQALEDMEARNVHTKSYHAEGHGLPEAYGRTNRGGGAITFTCVCEHCKLFQVEDFSWWVSNYHGEWLTKKQTVSVVGGVERAGNRMTGGSRKRSLTLQFGDLANLQVGFPCAWSARW